MRYGISPAERNCLESSYKVASKPQGEFVLPKIPGLDPDERSAQHEFNRTNKTKLYGKMRTRVKPDIW